VSEDPEKKFKESLRVVVPRSSGVAKCEVFFRGRLVAVVEGR
jgi:hypothetical protein